MRRLAAELMLCAAAAMLICVLPGCGGKRESQVAQIKPKSQTKQWKEPPEPPEPQKWVYNGGMYRDPLAPLAGEGRRAQAEATTAAPGAEGGSKVQAEGLSLIGVIRGQKKRVALLIDASGNRFVTRGGTLIDFRGKPVEGIRVVVGINKCVTIFSEDGIKKIPICMKKQEQGGDEAK